MDKPLVDAEKAVNYWSNDGQAEGWTPPQKSTPPKSQNGDLRSDECEPVEDEESKAMVENRIEISQEITEST